MRRDGATSGSSSQQRLLFVQVRMRRRLRRSVRVKIMAVPTNEYIAPIAAHAENKTNNPPEVGG